MARKSYSPEFKFSIVLEALKERKPREQLEDVPAKVYTRDLYGRD